MIDYEAAALEYATYANCSDLKAKKPPCSMCVNRSKRIINIALGDSGLVFVPEGEERADENESFRPWNEAKNE